MRYKKTIPENDNSLQNRFTAYLMTALHRKRYNVITSRIRHQEYEISMDLQDIPIVQSKEWVSDTRDIVTIEQIEFQNDQLEQAIGSLNERERFVLFNRVLAERSFEDIAADLNLTYKGTAAIYYRAMQKIKKNMGGEKLEF